MTGATAPRLQLELIAARILLPGAAGEAGYAARLDRLERRLDVGGVPTAAVSQAAPSPPAAAPPPQPPAVARRRRGPARPAVAPAVHSRGTRSSAAPPHLEPPPATTRRPSTTGSRARPARAVTAPPAGPAAPAPPAPHGARGGRSDRSAPEPAAVAHPKGPGGLDTDALRRSWPDVLEWLSRNKRVTWTFVSQNAQVLDYDGQRVLLGISTVGLADTFRRGAHADYVRQALIDVLGVDARVDGVPSDDSGRLEPAAPTGSRRRRPRPARRDAAPSRGPRGVGSPFSDSTASDAGARHGGEPAACPPAVRGRAWRRRGVRPCVGELVRRPAPTRHRTVVGEPARAGQGGRRRRAEAAAAPERVVDDTAISDDDESIDDLTDVGVPVVERILGGTVIAEDSR